MRKCYIPTVTSFLLAQSHIPSTEPHITLSYANAWNLDKSLTFSQTRNFRLFQTERVCKNNVNSKYDERRGQFSKWVNKLWAKETLLVTSNISFFHSVPKDFYQRHATTQACSGKGYFSYGEEFADVNFKFDERGGKFS